MRVDVQTKKRDPPGSRFTLVLHFNLAATQTPKTHVVVGVMVMMDRERLSTHSGAIIPSGQEVVNQISLCAATSSSSTVS
jgi:hypothetical protein